LAINGASHNVLFIGTMHDVMYAFDADNPGSAPLWTLDFRNAAAGIEPAPIHIGSVPSSDTAVADTFGIFGTPVIDLPNNRMFFVTHTLENGTECFRLRNVNILTGALNNSTLITGTVAASGAYAAQNFIPSKYAQRVALEIVSGQVWVAFGSRPTGDYTPPWEGWVMTYNPATLAQTGVFVTSRTNGNSIWESGNGPAVDASGNVYYLTGNGGTYTPGLDLPESLLQMNFGSSLTLNNWYTPDSMASSDNNPENYVFLDNNDLDLSCNGPMLIPGTSLVTFGSKTANVFVLNTGDLGKLTPNDAQVVQYFLVGHQPTVPGDWNDRIVGMAYWQQASGGTLFVWPGEDALHAYSLNTATSQFSQSWAGSYLLGGEPSTAISVSANGSSNGIVWAPVLTTVTNNNSVGQAGTLHAYDALSGTELWNSNDTASDAMGTLAKFVIPVVTNGKVYVANSATMSDSGAGSVNVYGLRTGTKPQAITFPAISTQTAGSSITLAASASSGLAVSVFTSSTPTVCTTIGNIATLLGGGTCTITAYQGGNTAYAAAPPVTQSFTVGAIVMLTGNVICAGDGGVCNVPAGATATVYYGAGASYYAIQGATGAVSCSPSGFGGDPDVNVVKSCYELITALPTGAAACATAETGTCTIPAGQTATVYYGAGSSYFFKLAASGAVGCNQTVFGGDPDYGVVKACYSVVNSPSSGPVLVNILPAGAALCAQAETGTCTVPAGATATVYYGSTGDYFYLQGVTGSLGCNQTVFGGDADYGIVKSCYALVTALPSGTATCAGEGGTCTLLSGVTTPVYYGVGSSYAFQSAVTGSIGCNVNSFGGDPDYGVVKSCYALSSKIPAGLVLTTNTLPAGTALCASAESGTCAIPAGSAATVYYGAGSSYIFKQNVTGSIGCNQTAFGGDPDYGVVKACYSLATVSTAPVSVSLASAFNVYGIFSNASAPTNGGLDNNGYAYSSSLLGTSVTWSGVTFALGAAGTADAVSGGTISLPAGSFPALYLLAAGVNGAQENQTFIVTYTDGTTTTFTQSLSDWGAESSVSGEAIAAAMAYRVTPSKTTQNGPWHLYGYSFPLNAAKTVKSITLPANRNVVVLAVSL